MPQGGPKWRRAQMLGESTLPARLFRRSGWFRPPRPVYDERNPIAHRTLVPPTKPLFRWYYLPACPALSRSFLVLAAHAPQRRLSTAGDIGHELGKRRDAGE